MTSSGVDAEADRGAVSGGRSWDLANKKVSAPHSDFMEVKNEYESAHWNGDPLL